MGRGPVVSPMVLWQNLLLLGCACTYQGTLLSASGRNGEAARMLEQAITVHRQFLERDARSSPFRHGLALALLHSGRVQVELGLPGRAEPELREALGLMRQLVLDDPLIPEYRATRLLAVGYLGDALFRQGRTVAAAELLREVETGGRKSSAAPARTSICVGNTPGCSSCWAVSKGSPETSTALSNFA